MDRLLLIVAIALFTTAYAAGKRFLRELQELRELREGKEATPVDRHYHR